MIINLPAGQEFDLASVANELNTKLGMTVSISQMGNVVYIHSKLTKEQMVDAENIILGKPIAIQVKAPKKKVSK